MHPNVIQLIIFSFCCRCQSGRCWLYSMEAVLCVAVALCFFKILSIPFYASGLLWIYVGLPTGNWLWHWCFIVDRLGQWQLMCPADWLHFFYIITHSTQVWSPIYKNHYSAHKTLLMVLELRWNEEYGNSTVHCRLSGRRSQVHRLPQ